jgi:hypothetical protein
LDGQQFKTGKEGRKIMTKMTKKGFALTLLTVAIALVQVSTTHATAPVISNPGDIIIGDLEDTGSGSTSTNVFVAPDLVSGDTLVSDDTPDNQIKWSFFSASPDIEINGVTSLDVSLSGLGQDDPTSPRLANRLDLNDDDDGTQFDTADANARTFTFRNVALSPNAVNPGDTGTAGPPGQVGSAIAVTLYASDCTTFGQRTISVFTIRGESDSLSGGGPEHLVTTSFLGNDQGWIGGAIAGFGGSVSSGASGLCMTVPGPGSNLVLWFAPEAQYVDLLTNTAWRVRTQASTTQTTADAIPIWFFIFDNFYLSTPNIGNNYGGFHWVLDNLGGAEGIGRAQGRTSFDFWYTPNATPTAQWMTGAFTPAADAVNDTRLQFQVIDANPGINTDLDSGTICIEEISVFKQDRDSMQFTTVFSPPIDSSTHLAFDGLPASGAGTVATIDDNNNEATFDLATSADDRGDLIPYDEDADGVVGQQFGPREFNPVVWTADTVVRNRTSIRAAASEADPVDAIFIANTVATNELGTFSYTTRTGNGVMVFVASPKLTSGTYEGYLYTQNLTLQTPFLDHGRLAPSTFMMNTGSLFLQGTGADAQIIDGMELDTIVSD